MHKKNRVLYTGKTGILCKVIMEPGYAHENPGKKLEKWTYAQSYLQFPQKSRWITEEKSEDMGTNILYNMPKKIFLLKTIDKSNVE